MTTPEQYEAELTKLQKADWTAARTVGGFEFLATRLLADLRAAQKDAERVKSALENAIFNLKAGGFSCVEQEELLAAMQSTKEPT